MGCSTLVIFILYILRVTSFVTDDKFLRYPHWDGYKCHADFEVFYLEKAASVLDCARHCTPAVSCNGMFFNNVTSQCVGCTSQCNAIVDNSIAGTNIFYRRIDCPAAAADWVGLPQGCSTIQVRYNQSVSQDKAAEECASVGASLVKIDERWKMDAIRETIQICEGLINGSYWVDGSNANATDYLAADAWRYSDDSLVPMDKYYWAAHAPNSPETHHCFRLRESFWDDTDCSFPNDFICEK